MTSEAASLIVVFLLALALLAATLAGLWVYTYGTMYSPALEEAIGQMRDSAPSLR